MLLYRIQRKKGGTVGFCWVPAHKGIHGNEAAYELAKKALENEKDIRVPRGKGEIKSIKKKNIKKEWQEIWDKDKKAKHLYKIKDRQKLIKMNVAETGYNN